MFGLMWESDAEAAVKHWRDKHTNAETLIAKLRTQAASVEPRVMELIRRCENAETKVDLVAEDAKKIVAERDRLLTANSTLVSEKETLAKVVDDLREKLARERANHLKTCDRLVARSKVDVELETLFETVDRLRKLTNSEDYQ
jgi:chromosome segregation ATPase